MATTLELFWNLSSSKKKERLDATAKLVTALHKFQSEFTPVEASDGEETSDSTQADTLDMLNAQDVSYSIRRLIRGLASPRESSRLGFAVALTELLSRLGTVTCGQIMKLVLDASKTQGSMSGQEERDNLFARLFGITSIIHSGLIARNGTLPTSSTSASSLESYELVVSTLIALGEKKSWLRESAWWALAAGIEALAKSNVEWKEQGVEATFDTIYAKVSGWTPEKLALTLRLQTIFPERDWGLVLSLVFKGTDILATQNLKVVAKILKESSPEEDAESSAAPGTWKPQLHFVWTILLDLLLPQDESASSKGPFQDFWSIVVDESLFSATSSPERKYWGFQLFQKTLPKVRNSQDLPFLFTKNFMRTWINHLSKSDRYLHKAALSVASDINSRVQSNPTLGFTLILQLTGVHGSKQFDSLTKTKTVENILSSMSPDDIVNYINYLLEQVNDESTTDAKIIHSRRSWIISQLALLIRNSSIPKVDAWVFTVLDWLTFNGLFVVTRKGEKSDLVVLRQVPKPPFPEELRKECRIRLLSSVAELAGQSLSIKSGTNEKASRTIGVSSNGEFWVLHVLETIKKLEAMQKKVHLAYPIDHEDGSGEKTVDKAQEELARLKMMNNKGQQSVRGAQLLLAGTILQQYCTASEEEDDENDNGVDMIDATLTGITRLIPIGTPDKDKKKKKRKSGVTEEPSPRNGGEPPPIDVLADIVIGFLEKGTAFLRTVANQSFSLLSAHLERSTIELVLTQLERRDPAQEDEGEDEEMEEEEEDSESDNGSDDDEEDEAPDLELRSKIEEALQVNGIEPAEDSRDDDSEEELMDDDQMVTIDEQLSEIFRSRASEKRGGKDANAKREATHFKNRVLDLVDIYIKRQPSSPYIPLLVTPLLRLVVGASPEEGQLSEKATGILRSRIGKLKDCPENDDAIDISLILRDLHSRASHASSADILTTIGQCCCYLVRALNRTGANESVQDIYRQSLKDFVTRKTSRLNPAFFQEFIRRCPEAAWESKRSILDTSVSEKAVNTYRKCQVWGLLNLLFNNIPTKDDISEDLSSFIPSLQDTILEFLVTSTTTGALTTAQMKDIFKLVLTAIRQTKRFFKDDTGADWPWKSNAWGVLLDRLINSEKYGQASGLHAMCKQVRDATCINGPRGAKVAKSQKAAASSEKLSKLKAKRKLEEVGAPLEKPQKPKKKKAKVLAGTS